MAQPTEPVAPEASAEAPRNRSFLRYLLLLPIILLPASAGAYLAYDHYPRLARTAAAIGITRGLQEDEPNPAPAPHEFGQFKIITDLMVNPAGTNGKRFLMVHIGLESRTGKVFEEVDSKDAVIRDIILRHLGRRTVEELSSVASREELKEELRSAINTVLQKGQIDRLYFTQFILQ